jgi:hypothetical protein
LAQGCQQLLCDRTSTQAERGTTMEVSLPACGSNASTSKTSWEPFRLDLQITGTLCLMGRRVCLAGISAARFWDEMFPDRHTFVIDNYKQLSLYEATLLIASPQRFQRLSVTAICHTAAAKQV